MRKVLSVFLLMCGVLFAAAQTTTLTFTGRDANNHFIPLNRVVISNLTKGWQETIFYPDTILVMGSVGIDDYDGIKEFQLSQNAPNPFDGNSDFSLCLPQSGKVTLEVNDLNGKKITSYSNELPAGCHVFRVLLSTPQSYVLTARCGKDFETIKMVNTGNAGANALHYLGEGNMRTLSVELNNAKGQSQHPFTIGDLMEYVGYANIDGIESESQRILQQQGSSQTFILQFSGTQVQLATSSTDSITNVTQNSATCCSHVISDGGASVTTRGVCWSTNQYPTMADNHTTDGSGTGSFTSSMTGLAAGTTYYVRAYATNSVGTAYGNQVSFTTTQVYLPTVTTNSVTNITENSATCGGNVTADGGASVTARGFCWSTNQYPTIADNHTTDGSGTGSFTSSMTGLSAGTTYYVRAYATNNVGTAYGNQVSFTTTQVYLPTVTTNSVANITENSATCGGNVTADGGYSVIARGVCWSTSQNPTIADNHTTDGSGTGSFTSSMTGLSVGTTYYVRAYATNSAGTAYGNQVSFTTTQVYLPTVTTNSVTNITENSATCGGNVTADGGASVTARGVCWSTNQYPTMADNHTTDGSGTGSFTSSMTGLAAGTTYYVRAYATNNVGTAYGNQVSFTTTQVYLPTVTTNSVTNITENSATCGGNVTADGGASVTARGFCWSTNQYPTIADNHTTDGSGTGSFSSSMTGLSAGTTYYVRAYATNSEGTAYGSQKSFTTTSAGYDGPPCPGAATVTDHEGNVYNTVQIGNQCWTKENMRCTTSPSTGTTILNNPATSYSYSGKKAYYPNGNASNVATYGLLYNWNAAVDTFNTAYGETSTNTEYSNAPSVTFSGNRRGICPTGWHVPSDAEWTQLENYVGSQSAYQCNGSSSKIAKALASATGWSSSANSCAVGNNPSLNNATGFSAVPAGIYNGSYYGFGGCAYFWSATQGSSDFAYGRGLFGNDAYVTSSYSNKSYGYSVRCLMDESGASATLPTVTTTSVANITQNSATSGGTIPADGGAAVTARGVCWSTSQNPTTADSHTTDGSGTGNFTSSITGLQMGTTYYVRAYATNSEGTAYGSQKSFTTTAAGYDGQPCPGAATVTDYDGNTYNTVQIGQQCWMKQNLKTKHYSDGTTISLGSTTSETTAYRYYPNNSSNNASTYGYLYNWKAVMRNSSSSSSNPSGVQGICPTGWHVPSDAEWTQLENYVGSQSAYQCNGSSSNIAKALASATGWDTSIYPCAVGNNPSLNNATGFSAVPAGYYGGSYGSFGSNAYFWSAAQYSSDYAYSRYLYYRDVVVYSNYGYKYYGYSVRCLRDAGSSASLPTVTTTSVTSITQNSATSGGNVTATGGASVTARGVCWSTSQNPTVSNSHTTNGSGTGSFTSSMTGLTAGTTYYVRAYATNSVGTSYGNQVSFTTPCAPAVTTTSVTNITQNSATCGGNVTSNGGASVTARGVCWSTSQNPTISNSHTADGSGTGSFSSSITGLSPNTTYYVRAYATNSAGTAYGNQVSFTTTQVYLPTVTTNSVTNITENSATCGGNVTADGGASVTARGFCWSTNQYPTIADNHTTDGSGTGSFTSSMTGLSAGTTYYVRAYATNNVGTAYGNQVSFTTTQVYLPTVTTNSVTNITENSATCGGNVTADVGYSVIARGVCWSTSQNPTMADNHTTDGSGTGSFTSSMTGLSAGTTYYVRAYATNSGGTAYGNQVSFTTTQVYLPTVTTNSVTNITENSATCGGNVTFDGGASVTARGVCWSTNHNPTIANSHTTNGSGTGSFTSSMTGLSAGTTYYVRAYATNSVGTAYGNEYSVITHNIPTVTTQNVTDISNTTATCGGNVTDDGGANVTARGVCWRTNHYPTIADSHTTNGSGTGSFTSSMTGLSAGTTYYVRAYATNSVGTAYGNEYIVITHNIPTVTTQNVTDVSYTTATCGGNVTSDGGTNVTARGVCWSTSQNPTIADTHTTNGTGTENFTSSITGLTPNTTYYVRAYATNSVGTAYGNQVSFTTAQVYLPTVTTNSVTNITENSATCGGNVTFDGGANVTVRGVCWSTSQNPTIADSHTADGSGMGSFANSMTGLSTGTTYYVRAYATNSVGTAYGNQVSFTTPCAPAVTTTSVTNITQNSATCGGNVTSNGGASVTARGVCWSTSQNPTISNSHTADGSGTGSFSSSITGLSPNTTYYVRAYATNSVGTSYGNQVSFTTATYPTVTTGNVSNITWHSGTCGGNVTSDGGSNVTARGVCWSTSQNPTISNSHTTNGSGTGSFSSSLTDLSPNTTYYVRAYATNSVGTAYGNQVSFTTGVNPDGQPCSGTPTVTDVDNNTYNTVQIGNQCWMKENLRTTRYADGTSISLGSGTSTTTAYRYYPHNNSSNVITYGYLYNWKAVMRNSSSSWANPSGVQGICPAGWHVPSDAEWMQLTDYVSSQSGYVCGNDNTKIAKALASTTGWSSSPSPCAPGNNPSANNATGFSAVPAGYYNGSYNKFCYYADVWSATQDNSSYAYYRYLFSGIASVDRGSNDKANGFSVRCLRD